MVLYKSFNILWVIDNGIDNIQFDLFRHVITEYMGQVCAMETQPAGHQLLNYYSISYFSVHQCWSL
jgi:hypothetical protein